MIVVHHLENSRSQRVLWLLEELEIPYEVQLYKRDSETMMAPPALRAIHPLGKSPVITDQGKTIAESGAIVEDLITRYGQGRLIPPEGPDRDRYRFWLHYAEGSAMPPLLMRLVFGVLPARSPALIRPLVRAISSRTEKAFIDPQLNLHMDYWEAELGKSEWFAGAAFTGADIQMSFPAETSGAWAELGAHRPKLAAFVERIHARPAYQRALERGGPYIYGGSPLA